MKCPLWPIATVGAVWVATRLWSVWLLLVMPWVPFDTVLYAEWADLLGSGSFPVDDPRWQYPDLMALLLVIPAHLPGTYLTEFVALALLADALAMGVLLWGWRRDRGSLAGTVVWATAGLWVGPTLLVRLDIFPTLFAIAAVVWAARPMLSALLSAVGFGFKLWPVVTILALPKRALPRVAAVFVAVFLLGLLAARVMSPAGDSFIDAQVSRGLHAESVGALPYVLVSLFGAGQDFSETHGTIEVVSGWSAAIGLGLTLLGILMVATLAWQQWSNRMERVPPGDVVFVALLILVATGRVFSPQFYVWLAGIGAVCLLSRSSLMRGPVILIVLSAIAAQYVYPLRTGWPMESDPLIAQVFRVLLLLAALVWACFRLWVQTRPSTLATP